MLIYVMAIQSESIAQHPPVTLPGTEIRSIHSDIINQDFELYIKLPWSYEKSDTTYPVLFTTDANRTFPIYSTHSLIYETPGSGNDEIIIVGIGYKVSDDRNTGLAEWAYLRNRDLMPVRNMESENYWKERLSPILGPDYNFPQSGGGADFLKFIQEELIPFIEKNYRISQSDRGLAGYSLGGLFTLYTLFHAPETFNKYFAGSPSSIQQCVMYESEYAAAHDDLKARILITANDSEKKTRNGIQILADSLWSRNYPGITMDTCIFEDENHTSGGSAAIGRALYLLYYNK
jgi:predicted alpha/beta superfamily hydrolase